MKILITETQYNIVVEGNKRIDAFQELINQKINTIKEQCGFNPETEDYDDNTEDFKICDEVASIEYIIVKDVETFSTYKVSLITIKVDIMYNFFKYRDYDAVIYELEHSIEKSTGLPIKIEYESRNLNTNPQW